jgi:predicted MPP superfamily phosphohydrolase
MNAQRKTVEELCESLEGTVIMLDHQPAEFARSEQAGVDLLLCGHTHKGQVFPATLIAREIFKKSGATYYGYWKGQVMQAVVTSGAGIWGPPVRIGTNSEVVIINVNFVL